MAEIQVTFDTAELELLIKQRFGDKIKNLPWQQFGTFMLGAVDEMFETSGAAGTDGEWTPLAASTIERRPDRAGGQILEDTGAMAAIQIFDIGEDSVTIGSNPRYAKYHLDGTSNMDKRDFFALNFAVVLDDLADLAMQEMR